MASILAMGTTTSSEPKDLGVAIAECLISLNKDEQQLFMKSCRLLMEELVVEQLPTHLCVSKTTISEDVTIEQMHTLLLTMPVEAQQRFQTSMIQKAKELIDKRTTHVSESKPSAQIRSGWYSEGTQNGDWANKEARKAAKFRQYYGK